jgi:hypothetical protein
VGPFVGCWDGVRDIKDDKCGRSEYKGENHADQSGIFCFEGGYEGASVWVVLHLRSFGGEVLQQYLSYACDEFIRNVRNTNIPLISERGTCRCSGLLWLVLPSFSCHIILRIIQSSP